MDGHPMHPCISNENESSKSSKCAKHFVFVFAMEHWVDWGTRRVCGQLVRVDWAHFRCVLSLAQQPDADAVGRISISLRFHFRSHTYPRTKHFKLNALGGVRPPPGPPFYVAAGCPLPSRPPLIDRVPASPLVVYGIIN